jgi:membrane fusion protein, heavy metal efflux system
MRKLSHPLRLAVLPIAAVTIAVAVWAGRSELPRSVAGELASQANRPAHLFSPSAEQWKSLTIETIGSEGFRPEHITEGKIAIDEDRSTPIFSPYSGRVTRLLVKPGDTVERGQPLFIVEAADAVQAQNDLMAAIAAVNKARSQLNLTQTIERRLRSLYEGKAAALKDWQQSQADLTAAENDLRSAQIALEAGRNRLRILGKTDSEISKFEASGVISTDAPVSAPIAGTVVQRKVGPGQYVTAGSSDPVFMIGDLSTVWLVAYVRETDAPKLKVGQSLIFTTLADAEGACEARLDYVANTLDPVSRRLLVRATVPNPDRQLKPEMFASVAIFVGREEQSPAVPRQAVIYEGDRTRVWVVANDRSLELREITTGLTNRRTIQVLSGLTVGEHVITKGSLFIDRAVIGS